MSEGGCRVSVIPDKCSSFQKRFEGCAYAYPVSPVRTPGFVPTKRRTRFCGIVSRRRDRELEDCREGVTRFCRPERVLRDIVEVIVCDTRVDEDERVERRDGYAV